MSRTFLNTRQWSSGLERQRRGDPGRSWDEQMKDPDFISLDDDGIVTVQELENALQSPITPSREELEAVRETIMTSGKVKLADLPESQEMLALKARIEKLRQEQEAEEDATERVLQRSLF